MWSSFLKKGRLFSSCLVSLCLVISWKEQPLYKTWQIGNPLPFPSLSYIDFFFFFFLMKCLFYTRKRHRRSWSKKQILSIGLTIQLTLVKVHPSLPCSAFTLILVKYLYCYSLTCLESTAKEMFSSGCPVMA